MDIAKRNVIGRNLVEGDVVEIPTDEGPLYIFIDQDPYYDIEAHKWFCYIQELTEEQMKRYLETLDPPRLNIQEWDIKNGNNVFVSVEKR